MPTREEFMARYHQCRTAARQHVHQAWNAEDRGDVHLARMHEREAARLRREAEWAYWRARELTGE